MAYLVDSDWVIDHLAEVPEAVALLDSLAPEGLRISIVPYMEVFQGIERSADPEQAEAKFRNLLSAVSVLPLSLSIARRCARLRETLRRQGKRVNPRALDLLNAAVALEYDLTFVTRNIRDYDDVPGLRLWREG